MKKLIFIFFVLTIYSCEDKDGRKQSDIYTEWKWESTLSLNGDTYSSAQELDSTYYYNFQKNGILEIKDINKVVKYEKQFQIAEVDQTHGTIIYKDVNNNSGLHFGYSIENNKLKISNVEGILVWTNVFNAVGQ